MRHHDLTPGQAHPDRPHTPIFDPTRGRSAGTVENPLRDPTRGRSAGTHENPQYDPTDGRPTSMPRR
jgi:hypothetical protein